jgi:hypothetical protein
MARKRASPAALVEVETLSGVNPDNITPDVRPSEGGYFYIDDTGAKCWYEEGDASHTLVVVKGSNVKIEPRKAVFVRWFYHYEEMGLSSFEAGEAAKKHAALEEDYLQLLTDGDIAKGLVTIRYAKPGNLPVALTKGKGVFRATTPEERDCLRGEIARDRRYKATDRLKAMEISDRIAGRLKETNNVTLVKGDLTKMSDKQLTNIVEQAAEFIEDEEDGES